MSNNRSHHKLIICIGSLAVGGTETHLSLILPPLHQQGIDISIITLDDDVPLMPFFLARGIRVHPPTHLHYFKKLPGFLRKPVRLLYNLLRIAYFLRKNKPAIFHSFLPEACIIGFFAHKLSLVRSKIVMSRRSLNEFAKRRKILGWFAKQVHHFADKNLVNSNAIFKQLVEEGTRAETIVNIYNGINLNHSDRLSRDKRSSVRQELNASETDTVFIIVANLIPYKGHETLLKALSLVDSKLDWKLWVVGDDRGILSQLIDQATYYGINHRIQWLGYRDDVKKLCQSADVGTLVSYEEGFSNAILEKMSCHLPMVVTDVGGNAEAVIHGECGLVVATRDEKSLCDAIEWMCQHKKERRVMAKNAHDRVKNHFTIQSCVDHYMETYKKLFKSAD